VTRKYLRQVPLDPVTEATDWVVIAPADTAQGNVYDVQPAAADPGATTESRE